MNTELILYRPNLIKNGKFANVNDYGWVIVPDETDPDYAFVKVDGSLSKVPNVQGMTIVNQFILTEGVQYRVQFTMSNRTAGSIAIRTESGPADLTATANQSYDFVVTAKSPNIAAFFSAAFDGTISNFSVIEIPDQYNIDLTEDIAVPLTFALDDISNVQDRKATFSKTVAIPGTHNVNKALSGIYKINSESLFNPNIKSRTLLKRGGITAFDGTFCLDDIIKNKVSNSNIEKVKYNTSLYGETLNLFDKMGDLTIKDLDFSMYDHPFCIDSIYNSWTNNIQLYGSNTVNRDLTYTSPPISSVANVGGFFEITFTLSHSFNEGDQIYIDTDAYQLIGDYKVLAVTGANKIKTSAFFSAISTPSGNVLRFDFKGIGPYYPMCDYGKYQSSWLADVEIQTDGLLVVGARYRLNHRDLGDDFSNVGSTNVDGSFFTATGTTPNIWIGQSIIEKQTELIIGRAYYIEVSGLTVGGLVQDDFTNVGAASNNHGEWFIATGPYPNIFRSSGTVLYQLDVEKKTLVRHDDFVNHWVVTDFIPHIFLYEIYIKLQAFLGIVIDCPTLELQDFKRLAINCDTKFNLSDVQLSGTLIFGQTYIITNYLSGDDFTNIGASSNANGVVFQATGTTPSNWSNGSTLAQQVLMNQWLPGIKLKDFFKGILNMHNLAVLEDKEIKNLIYLVNRQDFYNNQPRNWSNKVDDKRDINITLSNKILPTYYEFKYKDASDFYNLDYNNDFGNKNNQYGVPQKIDRKFGDQPIYNRADFAQGPNIIEIPWEIPVLAGPIQPVVSVGTLISEGIYADSDKSISPCYYADSDGTNVKRGDAYKVVIVGIRGTSDQWTMNSENDPLNDKPDVGTPAPFFTRFYPYAGYTDDHTGNNISFGLPLANYSPIVSTESTTLYTRFWKRHIEKINSVHSRLVSLYVNLSVKDISELDFSYPIEVFDFQIRLLKVIDWDINSDGSTKIEGLKI